MVTIVRDILRYINDKDLNILSEVETILYTVNKHCKLKEMDYQYIMENITKKYSKIPKENRYELMKMMVELDRYVDKEEEKEVETINKNIDWEVIKNACRTTVNKEFNEGEPTKDWKKRLLLSEHSPVRLMNIVLKLNKIKSWISVHLVRHKHGAEHMVSTQRDDRIGVDRNASRQDTPVDHILSLNGQSIINISRKRLCKKAHKETTEVWQKALDEIATYEPELVSVCVPECVYRNGLCPEFESCGYNKKEEFEIQLREYTEILKNQINNKTNIHTK